MQTIGSFDGIKLDTQTGTIHAPIQQNMTLVNFDTTSL